MALPGGLNPGKISLLDNTKYISYSLGEVKMQIRLMPFFQEFADSVMTGKEYGLFRVQAIALAHEKDRTRHFEKVIKAPDRVIVVNYYLSFKLNTLFVLTAHIQRGG